jgi:hypothetical protein
MTHIALVPADCIPSPAQQVRTEIEARMVATLLGGRWLTDDIVATLLVEAQETALLHVMDGLPPDLRTLASHMRDDLRRIINARLRDYMNDGVA